MFDNEQRAQGGTVAKPGMLKWRDWRALVAAYSSRAAFVHGAAAVLSCALVLAIGFGTYQSIASIRAAALASATVANENLVSLDAARIRQTLAVIDMVLSAIAQDCVEHPDYDNGTLVRFMARLHLSPYLRPLIAVADAHGKVLARGASVVDDQALAIPGSVAHRDYFLRQRYSNSDTLQIGVPQELAGFDGVAIPLTRKILSPQGRFGGLVTLLVSPDFLSLQGGASAAEPDTVHAVMNMDGRMFVRQKGTQISYGTDASRSLILQHVRESAAGNFVAPSPIDGVVRLISYRLLVPYDVIAVSSVSVEGVFAQTATEVRTVLVASATVMALCLMTMAALQSGLQRRRNYLLEKNWQASREVFLLEQIPVMFLFARAGGSGPVIFKCNDNLLQALECTREELLGQPLDWLLPGLALPDYQGDAQVPRQLQSKSGKTLHVVARVTKANSFVERVAMEDLDATSPAPAPVPQSDSGAVFCISLVDVSQSEELRRSLSTSDLNFQRLLEVLPAHVVIFHCQEGLVWSNANASAYLGRLSERTGRRAGAITARIHPDDRALVLDSHARLLANSVSPDPVDVRLLRHDGVYRWFSIRLASMLDAVGLGQRLMVVCTDVEDRKHMEERAMAAQRLATTGQLAGGMAHDFNNLLSIIIGNLDLARANVAAADAAGQISVALGAAERGAKLVESLLTMASQQVLKPQLVDLNTILEKMLPLLLQGAGPRVKLSQHLHVNPVWVTVDVPSLEACLLNLVVNARDAMPGGGSVGIAVSTEQRLEGAVVRGIARLVIADTGCGMSEEVMCHARELFFTTKERGRGTGLGLAMVAGFLHQSGGSMDIQSRVGAGTTIAIHLPLARAGAPAAPATPLPTAQCRSLAGCKILVVDDEGDIARLIAGWCEAAGFGVLTAHDAEAAVMLLAAQRVDLVVSDVVMPGKLNGIDLARFIQEEFAQTRVLLMSGYSREAVAARLPQPLPMLFKPLRQQQFLDAACALLGADGMASPDLLEQT